MTFVQNDEARPGSEVEIGVAIKLLDGAVDVFHVGIVHLDVMGRHRLLHLAGHHAVRSDDFASTVAYHWSPCRWLGILTTEVNTTLMLRFMEALGEVAHIPYGVDATGMVLSVDGVVGERPTGGFTCATFVASVFESVGHPVAILDEWPSRAEDEEWRLGVVELLRSNGHEEAASHAESARVPFRLKPSEIAASVANPEIPVGFDAGARLGIELASIMVEAAIDRLEMEEDAREGVATLTDAPKLDATVSR